jgi:hypothetical protein
MALSLSEANKLTRDFVFAGIVEETVEEDSVLGLIPFENVTGTQVVWNRENSLGADSQYIQPSEEIAESTPTWSKQTQTLSILADRAEFDNFLLQTKSDLQSVEMAIVASKAKQMLRKFMNTLYYGVATGGTSSAFAGFHNLVSTSSPDMTVAEGSGSTGSAGQLNNLTELISLVKPGRPDALIMNRAMLRRLSSPYISNVQYNLDKNTFGDFLQAFAGIPIFVSDWITQTETISGGAFSAETGGATTTIFAVKFGKDSRVVPNTGSIFNNNGVLGIQSGGLKIGAAHELEKKDGFTRKLTWYHSLILGSNLSLARMDGITDAAWTV